MIFRHPKPLLLVLAVTASRAVADSITLRRSLTVEPGTRITLADVAVLEGPAAEPLADLVVADTLADLPGTAGAKRLEVSAVRDLLDADPRTNWAFLSLRGSDVRLRTRTPRESAASPGEHGTAAPAPENHPETLAQLDPDSVRAHAHRVLLRILKVGPEDLRVTWSASDAELLDETVARRVIHVQPVGSSARMPLSVTIYDGDRITRREVVRADIQVRRTVHVIAKAAPRGTTLAAEHTAPRTMWLAPGIDPAPQVIGEVTTRRLEPGAVVEAEDVAPPLIVERGKIVTLHCVAGAVALKIPARALEQGRDGETIRLEMLRTGNRVTARVSGTPNGPIRAVLALPSASDRLAPTRPPEPRNDR